MSIDYLGDISVDICKFVFPWLRVMRPGVSTLVG